MIASEVPIQLLYFAISFFLSPSHPRKRLFYNDLKAVRKIAFALTSKAVLPFLSKDGSIGEIKINSRQINIIPKNIFSFFHGYFLYKSLIVCVTLF